MTTTTNVDPIIRAHIAQAHKLRSAAILESFAWMARGARAMLRQKPAPARAQTC